MAKKKKRDLILIVLGMGRRYGKGVIIVIFKYLECCHDEEGLDMFCEALGDKQDLGSEIRGM